MITHVIGIDPSMTGTAVAFDSCAVEMEAEGREENRVRAIYGLSNRLRQVMLHKLEGVKYGDAVTVIEGYSMGSRIGREAAGELGYALRSMALYGVGTPVLEVPPSVLKKWVTGSGNAKKEDMKLHAYKRWGFEDRSNNAIDARCLRELGLWILNSNTQAARGLEKKCNWLK